MALVTEAFKDTYRRNFEPLVQQRVSKLMKATAIETGIERIAGEFHFIDQVGPREPTQVTTRRGDSPHTDQDFFRRMLVMTDWEDGFEFDNKDLFRTLDDPTNAVVREQRKGFARQIDRIVRDAATGTAKSGHRGATDNNLVAANKVAVDFVESGGATNSNLTVGKLRRTLGIMEAFDVDVDNIFFVASPSQKESLLRDDEVTSSDFNVKTLPTGKVEMFLGFQFIFSTILTKTGNNRTCFALDKGAVVLGFAKMPKVDLDPARSDKKFNPYALVQMTLGAVRVEEKRVVEITCDETK